MSGIAVQAGMFGRRVASGGSFEADLAYAANSENDIIHTKGVWDLSSSRHTSDTDSVGLHDYYTFSIDMLRVGSNVNAFGSINLMSYHTGQTDNWAFGVQSGPSGDERPQLLHRLNDYSTFQRIDHPLAVNERLRVVGVVGPLDAEFHTGPPLNQTFFSTDVARDLSRLLGFAYQYDSSVHGLELTDAAIWTRALSTAEINSYLDGTMSLFA